MLTFVLYGSDSRNKDKADILMLMYEFEARCKLQDPSVENIIEVLLKIPNPDPKPFETIAGWYIYMCILTNLQQHYQYFIV